MAKVAYTERASGTTSCVCGVKLQLLYIGASVLFATLFSINGVLHIHIHVYASARVPTHFVFSELRFSKLGTYTYTYIHLYIYSNGYVCDVCVYIYVYICIHTYTQFPWEL